MNPIVGIGEVLWDVYPDGRKVAGGAPFNFAFHCHQLGHDSVIVSRVGADDLGHELRDRVRALGLSDEYIQTDPDHPTGTVQVALDANKVPTYTITEYVAWDYIGWDEKLEPLLKTARAACFGTLAQRFGTPVPVHRFAERLHPRPRDLVVFDVNLRGQYFSEEILRWGIGTSNWIKINADELSVLSDVLGFRSLSDVMDAVTPLAFGCGATILTRGEQGCEIYRRWEEDDGDDGSLYPSETFTEPGVSAKVVDTVGAGDAFTAAMVCLHLEGRPLRECAKFATHYAARVCEYPGGTPKIDRAEVERAAGLK
ncbi:carbohydrate kinase [Gemmata sp. G18]|uniref:Carbohydrate kinase n=1 Tax=Gemmata palustris TaxID=2822762 RepID=A0ABS5C0G0_9BACT|nr:PfkB family carbohydrate kinase [Gemmata palustris]MBP3959484.1 carbohydrate kinase [Gemmata palustris]